MTPNVLADTGVINNTDQTFTHFNHIFTQKTETVLFIYEDFILSALSVFILLSLYAPFTTEDPRKK